MQMEKVCNLAHFALILQLPAWFRGHISSLCVRAAAFMA